MESDSSGIYMAFEKYTNSTTLDASETVPGYAGTSRGFSLDQMDGIFALLLICFLFLTRIYKGGFLFFKENSRLVFSSRENSSLFSETTITEFWYNIALVFQTILLTSIIIFAVFTEANDLYVPPNGFLTIVLFILSISLLEGLKYLFYKFMGYVFNVQSSVDIWLRSYIIVIEMTGIIAFIPVLIMVYSNNYHDILTIFFIILFIASRLIIFYRIIIFFLRENVNFLYLIVYLCSVEFLPYVLLYKGLTYLYKIDVISLLWH